MDDQQVQKIIEALQQVAKESTLGTFVKSFPGLGDKIAGQVGKGIKPAQQNIDAAGKDLQGLGKNLSKGESGLSKVLFDGAKSFAAGNASLKDAVNMTSGVLGELPIAGKLAKLGIQSIGEYTENSVKTFRNLSTVGAGLNGELVNFRQLAAASRLSLDEFGSIVKNNTETLAAFAGGVEGGTRNFARLSKDMFETGNANGKYAEQLYSLGYSFEDMNELIVDNINLSRMRDLDDAESRKKSLESALGLAKQMDVMAKLTGKDAKAAKDELTDRMRNGATQAKIRLLEKQGVKGAADAYKASQAELAKGPKILRDLFDDTVQLGVPLTEATKNFAATNREAYALAQKAKEATQRGDQAAAAEYARQAVAATAKQADSVQGLTISTMSQVSSVAQGQAKVLEETGPLIDNMRQYAKKQGEVIGETLTYQTAFKNMLKEMTAVQSNQINTTKGAADPLLNVAKETEMFTRNSSSAVTSEIAKVFSSGGTIGTALNQFADVVNKINDPAEINKVTEQLMRFMSSNDLTSATLEEYLKNPTKHGVGEDQAKVLKEILPSLKQAEATLADPSSSTQDRQSAQAAITAARVIIQDIDQEAMKKFGVATKLDLNTEKLKIEATEQQDAGAANQAARREEGSFGFLKRMFSSDDEKKTEPKAEEPNPRDGGSLKATGRLIENFGNGTPVTGHGNEGMITAEQLENMAMGVSNIIKSVSPNAGPGAGIDQALTNVVAKFEQITQQISQNNKPTSQSADDDPFDKLNSNIGMLVASSFKQLDVAKKSLKTQKNQGGNLFSSV